MEAGLNGYWYTYFDVILSKRVKYVALSIDSQPTAILEFEEYMDGAR